MTKYVTLSDKWRIAIDTNRNHMPEQWVKREGGKPVPGGRVTKEFEGWEHTGKYFPSLQRAVRWIAEEDQESAPLAEYVDGVERRIRELIEGAG